MELGIAVRRCRQRLGLPDARRVRDRAKFHGPRLEAGEGGFEPAANRVADLVVEGRACAIRSTRRRARRRRRPVRRGSRGARRSPDPAPTTSARYRCHNRSLCAYSMSSVSVRKRLPAAAHTISRHSRSISSNCVGVLSSVARASAAAIASQSAAAPVRMPAASRTARGWPVSRTASTAPRRRCSTRTCPGGG